MTIEVPIVVDLNVVYNNVFLVDAYGNRIASMIGTPREKMANAEIICCAMNGPREDVELDNAENIAEADAEDTKQRIQIEEEMSGDAESGP